jgi:hypothetical protein
MTNLFFQRIQSPGITLDDHYKKPTRVIVALIGALLILLAVGAAIFTNTGAGRQNQNTTSQGQSKPAALDLFP